MGDAPHASHENRVEMVSRDARSARSAVLVPASAEAREQNTAESFPETE
jgi:hypothetical protein